MDVEDFKKILREVRDEIKPHTEDLTKLKRTEKKISKKKILTITHKLIIVATFIFLATWVVAVISWFLYRELPSELLKYGTYLYGCLFTAYLGKSAYEYGKKYDPNYEDQDGA